MGTWDYKFLIGVLSVFWLTWVSSGDDDNNMILIDCGSPNDTQVAGGRLFLADHTHNNNSSSSYFFSTSSSDIILAKANFTTIPIPSSSFDSQLYQTARILTGVSQYTFRIKRHGRHWIRLYFFPFTFQSYNLSTAKFSVSAQTTTLLKDFQILTDSSLREYSLNITSGQLVLTFTPSFNSFAFINAIEILSIPDKVIAENVSIVRPQGDDDDKNLWTKALETVARVNMGNQSVSPLNDTLWRLWVSDGRYVIHYSLPDFLSNVAVVNFTETNMSEDIAPSMVYGTATRLSTGSDPRTNANLTWHFDVDPGFDYLVRFHFCDIVNLPANTLFNVYVNSWLVSTVDLGKETSNKFGAPYYMDAITRASSGSRSFNITVGTYSISEASSPEAILNGLEIMKMSNSKDSLVFNSDSDKSAKTKVGIIVGIVTGSVVGFMAIMIMALLLLCRRRRSNLHVGVSEEAGNAYDRTAIFSSSKLGYRFPLAVIQEGTNNFSEDLVIGSGGFGKVYKGVLKVETKVAVKRGTSQSQQGLAEFRTEIEMLSQFRHRHLVSLIGYCNEQNERIIIYEYMEKGSLKNHLFSGSPSLSWKQRLQICIGAARGLHYLHTGSAKPIIHHDVKSANILLDDNLIAKVADFGLSKTGPEIDKMHVSTAVKGSFGYLDPEYLIMQQLTEKSDVYSFGVVMFEVLCGRLVIDPSLPSEKVNLLEWVMKWQQERSTLIEDIVDPSLLVVSGNQTKLESVQKFVEIAKKCLAENGINRPSMGDVLWHLEYALRLEVVDERSNHVGDESSSQMYHCSDTRLSSMEYSMGSVADLSGVSMSKVFAQMVKEDMQ